MIVKTKSKLLGTQVVFLCTLLRVYGQGTLGITFDGPPIVPPGSAGYVRQYYESGMSFRPLPSSGGFVRQGGSVSFYPENGTTYLQATLGDSVMFNFTNGSLFGVVSVDLAEYSTLFQQPLTVSFFGYHADGSFVFTNFITDGIIDGTGLTNDFQTFYFGPEFNNLTRVEIPTSGWSLDNLVVYPIPEPSSISLLVLGGAALLAFRTRRK